MSLEAVGWALRDAPGVPAQCVGVLVGLADHADKHGRGAYPSAGTLAAYARKSERQVRYDLRMLVEAKLIRPGDQSAVVKYPPNRRPVVYDLAMELVASKPSLCAYCGDPADTTDHVIPISRGGTDLPANRLPACGRCNSSKRDLTLQEWIATGRAPAMALGVQWTAPLEGQLIAPLGRLGVQQVAPQTGRQPIAPLDAADLQEQVGVQWVAPQDELFQGCNAAQLGVQPTADKPSRNLKSKPSSRRGSLNEGREDVQRLCIHLADRITANGSPRPEIGKKWLDAARLMLDNDKRTEPHLHAVIDWCQDHEFWRSNILSMPKLREKYDQLRLQAERARSSGSNGSGHGKPQRGGASDDLAHEEYGKGKTRI
jgi:hypothetical protein